MGDDLTGKFDQARQHLDEENRILLGQQGGLISGQIERAPTAGNPPSEKADKQRKKHQATQHLLQTLDFIRDFISRLESDIADLEAGFIALQGEEWRENLALKILGEDDIPQRKAGESIQEYRERLEPLLIAQLLNDDGTIKDQYKNDPELRDYARWAQKQYHLSEARAAVKELEDPDTTPQRREDILEDLKERSSTEELTYADREAEPGQALQGQIRDAADLVEDTEEALQADQGTKGAEFLKI